MFLSALLLTSAVALAPAGQDAAEANPESKPDSKPTLETPATKPDAAAGTLARPIDAFVVPSTGPLVRESCDAVRTPVADQSKALTCSRWRLEWSSQGKVWGALEADSLKALQRKKARHVAFARQFSRAFGKSQDTRYEDPSPMICDQCDPTVAQGRWGEGQTFSGLESARALDQARKRLAEFETLFYETHAPGVTEVARLASERKTASNAKRYAKQLEQASVELAAWQTQLHQAQMLRSAAKVEKIVKAMKVRGAALDKGLTTLGKQVATTVAKSHAGVYAQEGANPAATPTLEVAFDGRTVSGTYRLGEASSVWFEGLVSLDGSLRGRSLMAPTGGKLSCKEHSEACGYEYIPSMIRFSVRPEPRKEVVELWFQRDKWVAASPFSRD
ncbi:MAG: hypothetical protein KUG77_11705 [Nannocystaceae bacterium]|nr:hypothetical protein [Nannocystaceae bacterium]